MIYEYLALVERYGQEGPEELRKTCPRQAIVFNIILSICLRKMSPAALILT
jgi:hypothetical protein